MRPLLGTFVEVKACGSRTAVCSQIDEAFRKIEQLQSILNFYDPLSDVSKINLACGRAVKINSETWELLKTCQKFFKCSNGVFDITASCKLIRAGTVRKPPHLSEIYEHGSMADIELLDDLKVQTKRPLTIDLGGIAKGYAVDSALRVLKSNSKITSATVNAGGDLAMFGRSDETIFVRDPVTPIKVYPLLSLRDGAVATSSGYFNKNSLAIAEVKKSNRPLRKKESVTVIAPDCITADALTKVGVLQGDLRQILQRENAVCIKLHYHHQQLRLEIQDGREPH